MRVIFHVDMDAFYAAVEQRDNPAYSGRPVVVGSDPKGGRGRGVVATCSYEARVFGIHSAQPISQAYRRCPEAIFVRPDLQRYREASRQIREILHGYTDQVEPLSIDEAFLDFSERAPTEAEALELARSLKHRIFARHQLTASVGIAPSKFVAKIASDANKPNGLVLVRQGQIQQFLDPLPVSRLWGVGPQTEERLHRLGIRTIRQLRTLEEPIVRQHFGRLGGHLWALANGRDERPVVTRRETKSVSHEHTFAEDEDSTDRLEDRLEWLSERTTERLRRHGLSGHTVILKMRYSDFTTLTRQTSFRDPVDSFEDIHAAVLELFRHHRDTDQKIRLLGVGIARLEKEGSQAQLRLFERKATGVVQGEGLTPK